MSCGGGSRAWSHAGGVRGRWCTREAVCIHCWELPLQRRGWERSAGSSQDERPPQETGRGRSHCEPHPQSGSACRLPSVPRQPPAECRPPQPQVGPPPAPQPALTAHSTQHRVQCLLHYRFLSILKCLLTVLVFSCTLSPSPTLSVSLCSWVWSGRPVKRPWRRAHLSLRLRSVLGSCDHC